MNTSEKIKQLRKNLSMTQQELADKCGYKSKATICRVEKNVRDATLDMIVSIAEALHTTPQYLLGWEEENGDEELLSLYSQLDRNQKSIILSAMRSFVREKGVR